MTNNYALSHLHQIHADEWIKGSGVAPEIVDLNVRSLSGTTPHEYLLYSDKLERRNSGRLSDSYLRRYQHLEDGGWWCSGVDILTGKDSLWGCFKPNSPHVATEDKKQKTLKYEHPPKVETEVFALKIPQSIANAIAGRYNLQFPEQVEFWQWVIDNVKVPIIITEGAKKAGALLSAGYCAIAIPGIFNGYRNLLSEGRAKTEGGNFDKESGFAYGTASRYLIPQLQILAALGREIYFAFDSDSKIKTIVNVNQAIEKTALLLEKEGCTCKVISWSNEHKGVDDLIVVKGVQAFNQAYQEAKTIPLWKVTRLKQLTYPVAVEIDPLVRYLPSLDIPDGVKLIGLKARKGRGKTYQIEQIVAQATHEGRKVLVLSHRRQLVANLCDRFGIDNVTGWRTSQTGGNLGMGLCIDSLRYQSQAKFKPSEWEDALVIIDEVEQMLWHMLAANTEVSKHRVEIFRNFQELIRVVLGSLRGQVMVADADLSDVSLDYLRSLVDHPPEPYIIHQGYNRATITKEEKWDVFNYDHTNPKRLIADLIEHIRRGGKPMVCVSAQKRKSIYGTINLEATLKGYFPYLKILRIDSETITDPNHPAYGCIEHLNAVLPEYDIVLASPSIETGVSMDLRGHFTSVWGIAGGVSADNAVCQALARVRENVPRYLWVSKVGCGRVGNGTTNVKELVTKQKRETQAHINLLLESEEYELHGINTEFQNSSLWCWARMGVRINLGMMAYRHSVLNSLAAEGHDLHNVDDLAHNVGHQYLEIRPSEDSAEVVETVEDIEDSAEVVKTVEDLTPDEFIAIKQEEVKHLGTQLKQVSRDNCGVYHHYVSTVDRLSDREYAELKRRQNLTQEQRARLYKTQLCRRYDVEVVSPELVALDEKGIYQGMKLHYYLSLGRPYLKRREGQRLEKMLKLGQGCLFSPDFNRHSLSAKIWLYDFLQFLPLLTKTEFHKDDPDLQRLTEVAKEFARDIKAILHVTISPKDTPVMIIRKLLRPLGIHLVKLGRFGDRSDRHYTYAHSDLTERYELFDRWLASEQPLPQDDLSPVSWALELLQRLESPARSFVNVDEANKFLKGLEGRLTAVLGEVEQVVSDFCDRFWRAFTSAISPV